MNIIRIAYFMLTITGEAVAVEAFNTQGLNSYEQSVGAAFSYAASSKACGHKDNYEQLRLLYEGLISYGITHGKETKLTKAWSSMDTDTLIEMGAREYSRTAKISCPDVQKAANQLIPLLGKDLIKK
jgi:hypothetical protein